MIFSKNPPVKTLRLFSIFKVISKRYKAKTKKKKKSKRKQGGQPGHKGVSRELLLIEEVDHIEVCNPSKHCDCGSRIKLTGNYRRHEQHELPRVKAIVTEYQLQSGVCFGCGKIHQAELPSRTLGTC